MERVFIDSEFQDLIDDLQQDRKDGNLIKLKDDATRLKKEAIKAGNEYAEAIAYYFLAGYCLMSNDLPKSIVYCNYVKENYKNQPFHYLYAMCCSIIGTAHLHLNERQTAISHYLDAYYTSIEYKFFDLQVNILNNIGSIFYELEDYERGIEYFLKAYDIVEKYENQNQPMLEDRAVEMLFVNLSGSYVRKNDFEQAKYWEQRYLERKTKSNDKAIKNTILINHILMNNTSEGHSQLRKGVCQFLELMKSDWNDLYSIKMIFEVIEICLKQKDIALAKKGIALVEEKMKNMDATVHKEQLVFVQVQLYELTGEQDKLFHVLQDYYEVIKQSKNEKKEMERDGVLSKIDLQYAEYRNRQVELKNKELARLNEIDSFTGLLNKAFFEKKVQERLQKKEHKEDMDVLFLIDIDNFKQINDTYGHAVGDQVIKEIASRLQNKTRQTDYVGRIGGDEFCALLLNVPNMEVVKMWLENFIKSVQTISFDKVNAGAITVSIGAAGSKGESTNLELFEKADQAMYEAKRKGKNRYGIYRQEVSSYTK